MSYLLLIIGFIFLIKGADFFVDGSSGIAKKLRIPSLIIGLTIVSLGTSAPELAVSLTASLKGQNDMAVANVIGSNIFNLLVVLGATALISPLSVPKDTLRKDIPYMNLSAVVFSVMVFDTLFQQSATNVISTGDGIILVCLLGMFMYYLIMSALGDKTNAVEEAHKETEKTGSIFMQIASAILGIIGIVVGGDMVVKNAEQIALAWGMSEKLVGLTIIAVGTSLPELVTSVVAAKKGEVGIAVGNAVGSSIFNILFILGTSAIISPIAISSTIFSDLIVMLGAMLLVLVLAITGKQITKVEGGILVGIYALYTAFLIFSN